MCACVFKVIAFQLYFDCVNALESGSQLEGYNEFMTFTYFLRQLFDRDVCAREIDREASPEGNLSL